MMRWGPFWLALLLVTVVQTTFVFVFHWDWLHLLLALALLCGLNAPTYDARIAAWIAGFTQDLCTESSSLGLFAFSFGAGVILLTSIRDRLSPGAWWMRCIVATLAGWAALLFVGLFFHGWIGREFPGWTAVFAGSARDALLAALIAVVCTELPWFLPRGRNRRFRTAR
jgi:hypothetical protein